MIKNEKMRHEFPRGDMVYGLFRLQDPAFAEHLPGEP